MSRWRSRPAAARQEIDLQIRTVRGTRQRGGRYVPTTIRKQEVVLRFVAGQTLGIAAERARQFGQTPVALAALLRSLYGMGSETGNPDTDAHR